MAALRTMRARLARLEEALAPALSPFERTYGSVDGFAAFVRAEIGAGTLDARDGPLILNVVRRWHAEGVWVACR